MVARCTFVDVAPEDVDACVEIFREQVLPAAHEVEGFKGAMLLVHPEDGRTMVIDFCESHELAIANERNGIYQREISKFADKIKGTPERVIYDVRDTEGLAGGPELLAD